MANHEFREGAQVELMIFPAEKAAPPPSPCKHHTPSKLIGVLEGEGIGPEVIRAALEVLAAVGPATRVSFQLLRGGPIGVESETACGQALSDKVSAFCQQVFSASGVILSGPGGGRFVYDLRRRFDLYCKLIPLKPCPALARANRLRPRHLRGVDILIVRDNSGGVYQGHWREETVPGSGKRVAEQTFSYSDTQVRRLLEAAVRAARSRRGHMAVILKDEGVPSVSRLWRDVAGEIARREAITCSFLNVDLAAYLLIQNPSQFDVIVTPNLFGDILGDMGGVLLGSRGLTFSGNFGPGGRAVYQTNHGSAHDLTGTDRANPVGQIHALAMLLRQSFGLSREAALIEQAVLEVWRQGWRTADLAYPGCRLVGTRELADRIVQAVGRLGEKGAVP